MGTKDEQPGARAPIATIASDAELLRELVEDVKRGLTAVPKRLPPKYFYDARGSELFEAITRLEEYYPTRAETALLERHAVELVRAARPAEIVEIGAGVSPKNQLLLEALHENGGHVYSPIDVSEDALRITARELEARFPWLEVCCHVGDFEKDLRHLPRHGRRLVCFLGSTIGNMDEERRAAFLRAVRAMLRDDEAYLMGVDLVKPIERLERAYNDAAGVTEAFNKNVLAVLNRELDGDIPVENFDHLAFYNREQERIEMHLVSRGACSFRLPRAGLEVRFEAGERLCTEISCKFTRARVERELGRAELRLECWIGDARGDFGLVLARPARGRVPSAPGLS